MKRALQESVAWLLTAGSVYLGFLLLDVYWNLANWIPRADLATAGLLAWTAAGLIACFRLSRATRHPASRVVAWVLCLGLIAAAVHAFPAEPLGEGWFGRESSSPLWYRLTRLVLMSLPALCQFCRSEGTRRNPA